MKKVAFSLIASFVSAFGPVGAQTNSADHGEKIFQRCAACHLPNGAGVPGAFPPLAGHVNVAAANDAGRDYLVMVVAAGVMGEIDVDGAKIHGVMPAQAGLTDDDIAAVLNYAAAMKPGAAKLKPFTAEEVASIRSEHAGANPTSVHAIRTGVFEPSAATAPPPSEAEK